MNASAPTERAASPASGPVCTRTPLEIATEVGLHRERTPGSSGRPGIVSTRSTAGVGSTVSAVGPTLGALRCKRSALQRAH